MSASSCPVILTYHSISEGPPPLAVSPALFAKQMEWLRSNARVVPLAEIVSALVERRALPAGTVALTFDDGYRDFYSNAFPVLQRLQLPATVFLPTDRCGSTNAWPGQPRWVKEMPLMGWREIGELAAAGMVFGSHSASHPRLDQVSAEVLEHELLSSKNNIAAHTGQTAEFFCYPYGVWNATVREAVQRHYRGACSTGVGRMKPDADPYALPRVDVHYLRNPALFSRLFTPPLGTYLALRRLIRRMRNQPEGYVSKRTSSEKSGS